VAFGEGDRAEELASGAEINVAFQPRINEFRGRRTVEMRIVDWQIPKTVVLSPLPAAIGPVG